MTTPDYPSEGSARRAGDSASLNLGDASLNLRGHLGRGEGREELSDLLTSGGQARDLTEQQISRLRQLLDNDLYIFATVVCGFADLTQGYHGPIAEFLGRWGLGPHELPGGSENFGYKRLMLEVSRDTFKTSLGTIANALWIVSKDPTNLASVGIFNAKESRTHRWISTIRKLIEDNDFYQRLYRERLPPGIGYWDREKGVGLKRGWTWSDAALEFVRDRPLPEPSISGHGATGSAAGWHFSHIIKDDIIELKHARSEVEMQSAWDWCETARYLESPAEQGNELWNYTRWHTNDVYARARKQWPNDYVVFHRPALEEDPVTGEERSSFPERMPTAFLQREREEKPFWFSSQRMLAPRAGKETSFDEAWMRYCYLSSEGDRWVLTIEDAFYDPALSLVRGEDAPRQIPLSWCAKGLLWDPAPSEQADRNREQHARNGILAVARDPWGRWFVLEALGLRKDPVPTLEEALECALRWGITRCHVEEVNFSKIYKHFANHLLRVDPSWKRFRKAGIYFTPQKAEKRHKDARIDALKPDWSAGFVYMNRPTTRSLHREAMDYPYGATRDLLDAFAMRQRDDNSYVIPRPETPEEEVERLTLEHAHRAGGGAKRGALDSVNWAR